MKTLIPLTALAALVASSNVHAQTPAYSLPSGYVTVTLKQGFNNLGLSLHPAPKIAGTLDVISSNSVQDTTVGVNFTTSLGSTNVIHILEITSGTAIGKVFEINTWTEQSITTVDNLVTEGVVAGDAYRIRKAPTLEEIFTTNTVNGPLTDGNASTADIVYVPTGVPGQYTQYFLSAAGAFRSVSPPAAAPNVPLVYLDGLFVNRRASGNQDLTVTGTIKPEIVKGRLVSGFNYLGSVHPVGSTIQNSGLENFLLAGSASTADIIYLPTATFGQYTQIFRSSANTWRTVSPPAVLAADTKLEGAIFINRRGSSGVPYGISAPSTWAIAQ
jgi:hypothetical protein